MLDVYLFRHGETYCNNDGRHTGWLPYGLNDTGREQADRAGEHFRDFPFDRYFCSDLVRTRETFEHIFGQRDDCEYTELLREANSGELAGMKYTECAEKYGERYAQARKTWSFRQFGGDDVEDLFARARGFLKKMEGAAQGRAYRRGCDPRGHHAHAGRYHRGRPDAGLPDAHLQLCLLRAAPQG